MRGKTTALIGFALLLVHGPGTAQELDAGERIARAYTAYSGQFYSRTTPLESDILLFYGRTLPRGSGGRWMLRLDVGGGFSLYGNTTNGGALLGAAAGVVRVFTGDYLELGGRIPLELFASAGVSGYRAWHPAEAPEESTYIPAITTGFGLRFVGDSTARRMVTLELVREERPGIWAPKLFFRLGINIPRSRQVTEAAPSERPRPPLNSRAPGPP